MKSGADHCSFVEHAPDPALLREQPGLEPRHLPEVGAGADEEQAEHQHPVQRVGVGHGDGEGRPLWSRERLPSPHLTNRG